MASYHLVVDERQVIEAVPLNEVAWHAGDAAGNRRSIGIEICESGDYDRTVKIAVRLTAELLRRKNLSVQDLRQHYDWSGKDCPWKIRRGHAGWTWEKFKEAVTERMVQAMVSKYFKDIRHSWQAVHVDSLREKGIIAGRTEDTFDPDAPITRAECAVVVNKAVQYLTKGGKTS
ncbi:MAG: N-acetylmuramoyl-L-alanine amidase, partial [Bacillota bacterium]|nr:N-acetylmuramoyl-L-alanine amidase [Bacillota bacterium]